MMELDPISGRALEVAQQVGLIGRLETSPATLEELAVDCDCSSRGIEALLYLLASAGFLKLEDDRFALASGLLEYLRESYPEEWALFPVIPEYEEMLNAVRTGRPIRAAVEGSQDEGEFFSAMTPALFDLHWPDADFLSKRIDPKVLTVLDLGAGSAVWSLPLAKSRSEVRVVAVDRAKVLESVTRDFVDGHGVLEQYEFRSGDYHEVELEQARYDLVLLGHLLHADGWEGSRRLLQRAKAALALGGYLAVAEILASDPRDQDYAANVFHLNMLMLTEEGVAFSRAELEGLAKEAGFRDLEWIQGPGDYPVLLSANL